MRLKLLLGTLLACASVPALADEGMWTFDNFPAAAVKQKYGVTVDQKWLDHVRASAVRLAGGCSASVVSPNGLVLTNHHCIAGCAQNLSAPEHDYVKNGFFTARLEDEQQCPGTQAEILQTIGDVTTTISAATKGKSDADFARARNAAIANVEKQACTGREATHRCQVITLYDGGQYKLYTYRKYSDVRLVFAVEFDTAFFGGDPDNFNFPRYATDFGFLRAYENGRPVASASHLRWNPRAPVPGEPVFVVGNPGSTQRLFTRDQFELRRDLYFPTLVPLVSELRGRLIAAMEGNAERTRTGADTLFGWENSYKVYVGQWQALRDPEFMGRLFDAERQLRARVAGNSALARRVGDPWTQVQGADNAYRTFFTDYMMLEQRAGFGSDLYSYARTLVRGALERQKPSAERLPAYADSQLPLLEHQLTDAAPTYNWLEELTLGFWLSKTRELLTADDPRVRQLLGRESPEALAHRLVSGTHVDDPAFRRRLWEGGIAAVRASDDPLIRFVLANDGLGRATLDRYRAEVDAPITAAQSRLAQARFAVYGSTLYPDATFTLRISYGSVQGWNERGREIAPITRIAGLYERATGAPPFDLPPKWAAERSHVNMDTALDFTSNNDIIGGNSGSPVIARDGSVIGAAFDGNIHSIGGAYGFDPRLNRTISVSTAAIQEALRDVYHADALLAELNGRR
jgi:hypothetical protein